MKIIVYLEDYRKEVFSDVEEYIISDNYLQIKSSEMHYINNDKILSFHVKNKGGEKDV